LGLAAAAGTALLLRERPRPAEVALLAAAAGVYVLWLRQLSILQERIHLIEYGALGALVYAALRERWAAPVEPSRDAASSTPPAPPAPPVPLRRWQLWPAVWAIVIAGAAGWGDELVQAVLPNRVYDLRDVATNAEAAALCVLVVAARARVRAEAARRSSAAGGAGGKGDGQTPTPAIE
jgi:hypothetical protein